jgi:tripeptidyl-peptidase I
VAQCIGLDSSYCTFQGSNDPSDPTYLENSTTTPKQGEPYNHPKDCSSALSAYMYLLSLASIKQVDPPSVIYQTRMCAEFIKLILQRSTFLFTSKDYRVDSPLILGCRTPTNPPGSTIFTPAFPATCPRVTAVSSSTIDINKTVHDLEVSNSLSGGGFSNIFPISSYQNHAVLHWFNHTWTGYPGGTFNDSRQARGIPDLKANAVNTIVAANGAFGLAGGTSASVGGYLLDKKLHNEYG